MARVRLLYSLPEAQHQAFVLRHWAAFPTARSPACSTPRSPGRSRCWYGLARRSSRRERQARVLRASSAVDRRSRSHAGPVSPRRAVQGLRPRPNPWICKLFVFFTTCRPFPGERGRARGASPCSRYKRVRRSAEVTKSRGPWCWSGTALNSINVAVGPCIRPELSVRAGSTRPAPEHPHSAWRRTAARPTWDRTHPSDPTQPT
jgi:hypothetical protein